MARTYVLNSATRPTSVHSADEEQAFELSPDSSADFQNTVGTTGALICAGTTPTNEPDDPAWPNATISHVIDVVAVDSSTSFGLLSRGGADGHFARVDATLNNDLETHAQDQGAFTGPGLHSCSFTGAWSAGTATDRAETLLAAVKDFGHGNDNITIQVGDGDSTLTGAWPGADLVVFPAGAEFDLDAQPPLAVLVTSAAVGVLEADVELESLCEGNVELASVLPFDVEIA